MEHSQDTLNIAFATNNQRDLNQHFGSCQQLAIYNLSTDSSEHLHSVDFKVVDGHNQDKINARLRALQGCFAVYCQACGNPVRQQLMANGIRVVIHPEIQAIDSLVAQIQQNWPGKIAQRQQRQANKKQDYDYFSKLADSEWDGE